MQRYYSERNDCEDSSESENCNAKENLKALLASTIKKNKEPSHEKQSEEAKPKLFDYQEKQKQEESNHITLEGAQRRECVLEPNKGEEVSDGESS